ncbi:hypothetical protein URH17368_2114 [Alicyclobacillus hesperidum URH17-3-68]|uniref:NAD(P)/FAD-dependent oxidoreductase n=1 Tax=Alicyclobacillus hesperidum TaxID=89784 RepID=A0A1H2RWH2_9BACL|nr:NAD(P)/FAD-dependent oxidoreductase [Alicyclobacillus hesperidum]EJY55374.1 hypothetical protein URH17368_2114 [Alicyclobacillus hesperidum URH17-3-68]SDW23490.1 hypothetical protein SAMN04489725_103164 [Alicyclobacillus hesperidum]
MYDVIVVGGGPAGLMAAISARECGARVVLVEKGNRLGRKLAISGGGRCNVTNAKPLPELMENIPGNAKFLYSALSQFSNHDIIHFFEHLGIKLKEEDRGRVFPVSNDAKTVVKAVVDHMYSLGVEVLLDTPVSRILTKEGQFVGIRLARGQTLTAPAGVIATGGCSVPQTGSTGDAYAWAKTVGHKIVDPYPTEVPLVSDEPWIISRKLQGLSLYGVEISIWTGKGKRLTTESGDLLFTHFGLSGPAALRCSHYVSTAKRRHPDIDLRATIDLVPSMKQDEWLHSLLADRANHPRRAVRTELELTFPERLAAYIAHVVNVPADLQLAHLTRVQMNELGQTIKRCPIHVTGTLPLEKATVTGGGVSVKEIDPKTMQSKLCRGLFFAGEVMDVHAHTGGYNITVAFSTGRLAGKSAAQQVRSAPSQRSAPTNSPWHEESILTSHND